MGRVFGIVDTRTGYRYFYEANKEFQMKLRMIKKLVVSAIVVVVLAGCTLTLGSGLEGWGWIGSWVVLKGVGPLADVFEIANDTGETIAALRVQADSEPVNWDAVTNVLLSQTTTEIANGDLMTLDITTDLGMSNGDTVWFKLENGPGDKYIIGSFDYDNDYDWYLSLQAE
jgi:hypothetical protein